jgi:hypothetical protein
VIFPVGTVTNTSDQRPLTHNTRHYDAAAAPQHNDPHRACPRHEAQRARTGLESK